MELVLGKGIFAGKRKQKRLSRVKDADVEASRNLTHGTSGQTYEIEKVVTKDESMKNFLFSLGCFEGEKITLISVLAENYVIHIKGARYSIDARLAKVIGIGEPEC